MLVQHLPVALAIFAQDDSNSRSVVDSGPAEAIIIDDDACAFQNKRRNSTFSAGFYLQILDFEFVIGYTRKLQLFKHYCPIVVASVIRRRIAKLGKPGIKEGVDLLDLFGSCQLKILRNKVCYSCCFW